MIFACNFSGDSKPISREYDSLYRNFTKKVPSISFDFFLLATIIIYDGNPCMDQKMWHLTFGESESCYLHKIHSCGFNS